MKRLLAAIIDTVLCFTFLCIIRVLMATVQKCIYNSKNIYTFGIQYNYVEFMFIILAFIIYLYQWIVYKKNMGLTLGKKVMGITINDKIVKQYFIISTILKIVATYIYPITILYYLIIGEMPYDRILKKNRKINSHRLILMRLMASGLILSIVLDKQILLFEKIKNYFFTIPIISIAFIDEVAGDYTGAIDLPVEYIGEEMFQRDVVADAGKYIFSDEGKKKIWGIVVTDKNQYLNQSVSLGCKQLDINQIDFNNYFLVCTFGRKVSAVRVLGKYENDLPPFVDLNRHYEEEKIYYYIVPKINVIYAYECIHFPERNDQLRVTDISYQDIKDELKEVRIADDLGFLGRWIWAFVWGIEDNYYTFTNIDNTYDS